MRSRGAWVLVSLGSLILWSSVSLADEPTYIGTRKCKPCHGKQFKSWQETKHAKAIESLKPEEQGKADCLVCHATGYGKEGGFKSMEETPAMAGVQCEACHGPGSIYFRVMKDKEKSKAGGLVEQTEAVCKACHNPKSPTFKPIKFDKNVGVHDHDSK